MGGIDFSLVTTKGGDEGKTTLLNGERRFKHEAVFDLLGTVDELSSFLGLARAHAGPGFEILATDILHIQKDLVRMGGHFASPPPQKPMVTLDPGALGHLEARQTSYMEGLELRAFVQPGATVLGAYLDVSRSVCRRAERILVGHIAASHAPDQGENQKYLNRLSDFLFVAARWVARIQGIDEFDPR